MSKEKNWVGRWVARDGSSQQTGQMTEAEARRWLGNGGHYMPYEMREMYGPTDDLSLTEAGCTDVRIAGPGGETLRYEDLSRLG